MPMTQRDKKQQTTGDYRTGEILKEGARRKQRRTDQWICICTAMPIIQMQPTGVLSDATLRAEERHAKTVDNQPVVNDVVYTE